LILKSRASVRYFPILESTEETHFQMKLAGFDAHTTAAQKPPTAAKKAMNVKLHRRALQHKGKLWRFLVGRPGAMKP
jgi:hypothetical protein